MKIFDARDVIQFALRIEEDGEVFYRKAALAAQDKDIRDLFNFLADEEIQHKALFREMFSKMEALQPAETYDGEYASYLSDYIDGKVSLHKRNPAGAYFRYEGYIISLLPLRCNVKQIPFSTIMKRNGLQEKNITT